jgi:hypothetical protein
MEESCYKVLALKFGYYYLDGEKAILMSVSDDIGILAYDKAKPRVFKSLSRTRTYLFYV